MHDDLQKSVADSLETEKDFLPFLPYLIQDLWALGCAVDQILELLGSLAFESNSAALLDLGCGKGAVSVRAADKFGIRSTGVDAMPEFLEVAKTKAAEYGVSRQCRFIRQDILEYVQNTHQFDVVVLASLGGIFGSNKDTVARMRTQIRSGGYIIIDDGYLKNQTYLSRKGYGHYRNYRTTIKELTSFGDQIVDERSTTEISHQINYEYLALIEKRGRELAGKNPEIEAGINKYISLQREECEILDRAVEGMIWVLQKR
jgi:ubiquinone/menaquinone biosynthesis C-methylase UbiE